MKKNIKREILDYALIIIAVILIRTFIFTPIKVEQNSMYPTLNPNDIMILNKIGYKLNGLKRFDIVVIKHNNDYLIKRVIGLPNETLEYKDNNLYINNKLVKESHLKESTEDVEKMIITKDNYFLLGDNRDNSKDSRTFGTVNKKDIIGKTRMVVFPINRIDIVKWNLFYFYIQKLKT